MAIRSIDLRFYCSETRTFTYAYDRKPGIFYT